MQKIQNRQKYVKIHKNTKKRDHKATRKANTKIKNNKNEMEYILRYCPPPINISTDKPLCRKANEATGLIEGPTSVK